MTPSAPALAQSTWAGCAEARSRQSFRGRALRSWARAVASQSKATSAVVKALVGGNTISGPAVASNKRQSASRTSWTASHVNYGQGTQVNPAFLHDEGQPGVSAVVPGWDRVDQQGTFRGTDTLAVTVLTSHFGTGKATRSCFFQAITALPGRRGKLVPQAGPIWKYCVRSLMRLSRHPARGCGQYSGLRWALPASVSVTARGCSLKIFLEHLNAGIHPLSRLCCGMGIALHRIIMERFWLLPDVGSCLTSTGRWSPSSGKMNWSVTCKQRQWVKKHKVLFTALAYSPAGWPIRAANTRCWAHPGGWTPSALSAAAALPRLLRKALSISLRAALSGCAKRWATTSAIGIGG